MMAASAPPVAAPLQSPAQLKAQLWADDRAQVYAVVMGTRIPELPQRLAAAQSANQLQDFDCLRPGALPPHERAAAPYLAWLQRESPFTDWLLFEAARGLGDWGVVACARVPLLALRSHCRGLLAAQLPGGETIALDWMDPEILHALLAVPDPVALAALFGPMDALVVPGAATWTTLRTSAGQLERRQAGVAQAA